MDSGACRNFTSNPSLFSSPLSPSSFDITGIGSSTLRAAGVGTGKIIIAGITFNLSRLYFVPGLDTSLISMSELVEDGCSFSTHKVGGEHVMHVTNSAGHVATIRPNNGMYYCSPAPPTASPPSTAPACLSLGGINIGRTHVGSLPLGELLHRRLGHHSWSSKHFADGVRKGTGLPHLGKGCSIASCDACARTRISQQFSRSPPTRPATRPLERVHFDFIPGVSTEATGGYTGLVLFIDEKTGYWLPYAIKRKSELPGIVASFKLRAERHFKSKMGTLLWPHELASLRSDGEAVNVSSTIRDFCHKHGIVQELSSPYAQWQNGLVERAVQSLWNGAQALRVACNAPPSTWLFAVLAFCFTRNLLCMGVHALSPYEQWNLVSVPFLTRTARLRVFGCLCYRYIDVALRSRLSEKGEACVMLGYSQQSKGYIVRSLITGVLHTSANVIFREDVFPYHQGSMQNFLDSQSLPPDFFAEFTRLDEDLELSTPASDEPEATPVSQPSQPSQFDVAEHLPAQADEFGVAEPLPIPSDESDVAEHLPAQADEFGVAEPLPIPSDESDVAEPLPAPSAPPSPDLGSIDALPSESSPLPAFRLPSESPSLSQEPHPPPLDLNPPSPIVPLHPVVVPPITRNRRRAPPKHFPAGQRRSKRNRVVKVIPDASANPSAAENALSPPTADQLAAATKAALSDLRSSAVYTEVSRRAAEVKAVNDLAEAELSSALPAIPPSDDEADGSESELVESTRLALHSAMLAAPISPRPFDVTLAKERLGITRRLATPIDRFSSLQRLFRASRKHLWPTDAPSHSPKSSPSRPTSTIGPRAMMAKLNTVTAFTPSTHAEAVTDINRQGWLDAIAKELESMEEFGVWELVPPPPGVKPLGNKWVFKIKLDKFGLVERLKARLTLQGFRMKAGRDYGETWAPTGRLRTFRALMAEVSGDSSFYTAQWDCTCAFLHAFLDRPVYMKQAPGTAKPGQEHYVCRLVKAIYGTKQASHLFHQLVQQTVLSFNDPATGVVVTRAASDDCLYLISRGKEKMRVLTQVDDFCVTHNSPPLYNLIFNRMKTNFRITDYDRAPITFFCGIGVHRAPDSSVEISQEGYIRELLARFNMTGCKPADSPERTGAHAKLRALRRELTTAEATFMQSVPYREAVGALWYIARATRFDIFRATQELAHHVANPAPEHWTAVERLFQYLQKTAARPLVFRPQSFADRKLYAPNLDARVVGHSDSDWAGCQDTSKSRTGWVVHFGGCLVAWRAVVQSTIAQSSCEAEYVAASALANELVWWRTLCADLGHPMQGASPIRCDSEAAIGLAKHSGRFEATKHIRLKYHVLRLYQAEGIAQTTWCPTYHQFADVLTKNVPVHTFVRIVDVMLGRQFCDTASPVSSEAA
jgi:hypothetical protein